jgi:hypothetical protein
LSVYTVIGIEIARWRLCISLLEFCVTKKTDGWELASEFDREVNYVHVTYRTLFLKCTCDYVNMCVTDDKFIVDISCSDVNDSLKILTI